MAALLQDFRYALRQFRKSPGFYGIAILTLGLGIGVNTAIFSMVDGLILRPLPILEPKQIYFLGFAGNGTNAEVQFSYPEFEQVRKQTTDVFSDMVPFIFGGLEGAQNSPNGLTVDGVTKPVQTVYVGGNFFPMLGIGPFQGRFILPSEGTVSGADSVVVLSYNYWQSRFGGDPSIVGKPAWINGRPATIVGIARKGFLGLTPIVETQAYLPLSMFSIENGTAEDFLTNAKMRSMLAFARVKNGTSVAQVQSALGVVGARLLNQYPRDSQNRELRAMPLRPPGLITGTGTNPFLKLTALFLILAGMVLALACTNVANLFLVRASVRGHEMAVRAALGAARSRLILQLLTESLLLALLGCIGGMAFGLLAAHLLSSLPFQSELPVTLDFGLDWRVFAYAFGVSLVTGVSVGILPALRASRGNLREVLREGGRTSTAWRQRTRSVLVAAEVGGALTLLIVAGLFVRSLSGVQNADLGFNPQSVLNFMFDAHEIGYQEAQGKSFYRGLLERARALPGVESASLASAVPLSGLESGDDLVIPGVEVPKGQPVPHTQTISVSSEYFKTMGAVLLRGREIIDSDNENSPRVAVINQAMAERYWPGQDPVGNFFTMSRDAKHPVTIIGVAKNSRMNQLYGAYDPLCYLPMTQNYAAVENLQIRTRQAPESLVREIHEIVQSLAPAMPVYGVRTMDDVLHGMNGLLLFEVGAGLAAGLGLLGLTLAIVGVYGVMSYSVSQRTKEIGIRMALGANPRDILTVVGLQGLTIVTLGIAGGLTAAFAVGRLVSDFLVGVSPSDPLTYVSLSLLLMIVALLASYVPARRATKVDPMVALRYE